MMQSKTKHVDKGNKGSGIRHLLAASGAELVGSLLVFLASYVVSSVTPLLYGPNMALILLVTGLAYTTVTLVFGNISGGQFNPAVTLAAMLIGKTRVSEGICYIMAQVVGAVCSGAIIRYIVPTSGKLTLDVWLNGAVNGFGKGSISNQQLSQLGITFGSSAAIVLETCATLIIVAVAMRTMPDGSESDTGKSHHNAIYAAAMGCAYAVGVGMTYPVTGSSLNPARATGIAIFAKSAKRVQNPLSQLWVFWVCAIFSAALVAIVFIVAQMLTPAISTSAGTHAKTDDDSVQASAQTEDRQSLQDTTALGHLPASESPDSTSAAPHSVESDTPSGQHPASHVESATTTPLNERKEKQAQPSATDPLQMPTLQTGADTNQTPDHDGKATDNLRK